MTTTTTTYNQRILGPDGQLRDGMYMYGAAAATPELAREMPAPHPLEEGDRRVIVRTEARLGGDGDYHRTSVTVLEIL